MTKPQAVEVQLSAEEVKYARDIAAGRHGTGGPSRPLDSGKDAIDGDVMGVMAEMAVCLIYRLDYREFVTVYGRRPGAIADLKYQGYAVSVKGSGYFRGDPDLVIPEYDVNNDIYILVNVDIQKGYCLVRGWVTRAELLRHEPEPWKWTNNRPGNQNSQKKRRYVPLNELHSPVDKRPPSDVAARLEANGWSWKVRIGQVIYTNPDVGIGGWYSEDAAVDLDAILQETGRNPVEVKMEAIRAQARRREAVQAASPRHVDPADGDQVQKKRRKKAKTEAAGQISLVMEGSE